MNPTPILHHYPLSPFSEKLRLIFGFKRLAWRSVLIPDMMPKPDVLALTGGYRKTPILQLGADIYCDTALAARVIDALQPEPPLFPASTPLAPALAQWADFTLFWQAIVVSMQPAGRATLFAGRSMASAQAFAADRAGFTAGFKRPTFADSVVQLQAALAMFDAQLGQQPWLQGSQPSVADFSVYHCLWFVQRAGVAEPLFAPHAALRGWLARMADFGHGPSDELGSAEAVAIAAAGTPAAVAVQPGLGFEAGQPVTVAATDYGCDPVAGTLVGLSADSVTVRRVDERAGVVQVHFPRAGFQILKDVKE